MPQFTPTKYEQNYMSQLWGKTLYIDMENTGLGYYQLYPQYNQQLYHYMGTTKPMATTIPGIPDGYESVAFREASNTECYLKQNGEVAAGPTVGKYLIVKKIIRLQSGKYYQLANGDIVGPMRELYSIAGGAVFSSDSKYGTYWQPNGRYPGNSSCDIVKEVPAPATHRPFKDAKEFMKYANRWILKKDTKVYGRAVTFSNNGIRLDKCGDLWTYQELANKNEFEFSDGSPVGIKLQ